MTKANLTNAEHVEMDDFLGRVLDAYKSGEIDRSRAISGLAQVMAALDIGNTPEAVGWFRQRGVSFFKR